jgi:hypothetical protein
MQAILNRFEAVKRYESDCYSRLDAGTNGIRTRISAAQGTLEELEANIALLSCCLVVSHGMPPVE